MYKAMRAVGRSMEYMILENDIIVYSDDCKKIKRGDLILYHARGQMICHRLYIVTPFVLVTAGDNCHRFEWIPYGNLVGKVAMVIRKSAKYAVNASVDIKKKYMRFMGLFIPRVYFMRLRDEAFFLKDDYLKLAEKRNRLQQIYLTECKVEQ